MARGGRRPPGGDLVSLRLVVLVLFLVGTLLACGGSKSGTQHDGAPQDDAAVDEDGGTQHDGAPQVDAWDGDSGAPPTGYHFWFDLGTAVLMGQTIDLGAGGFWPTAREDFDPPREPDVPLGTCVTAPPQPEPTCTTNADCAPEQQCVADTNSNNQPIAGTEHCETPRTLLDVGPFTVDGFVSGPTDFAYNSGQSGAYTTANPGDGTIPAEEFQYDTTYTISGTGDTTTGIGAFSGEIHFPPEMALTSPAVGTVGSMGLPGIHVSVTADLVLEWSGADPDMVIKVTLTGGTQNTGKSIVCRLMDTGTVTIPAAQVAEANLGPMALTNMLELRREVQGTASGAGLTFTRVTATQAITYNIAKDP
jgi:hypothetical protein